MGDEPFLSPQVRVKPATPLKRKPGPTRALTHIGCPLPQLTQCKRPEYFMRKILQKKNKLFLFDSLPFPLFRCPPPSCLFPAVYFLTRD